MGKKKEEVFLKIFLTITAIIFVLICAASIVLCIFQVCKKGECNFNGIEVSAFISFLALAFAIAVATPHFITKTQIETVVRDIFKSDIGPDIINKSEEISKLDAHLSRMVAFNLLQQKYYYWAVGWSFRSLKRYTELNESYSDLYHEFHDFVFNRIILVALKNARTNKENSLFVVQNVGEKEAFNIKIRAVKDYLDFLYLITEYSSTHSIKLMKSKFQKEIAEIESEMNLLIREFYKDWFKNEKAYRENSNKRVDDYFFSASRYKDNSIKLREFFYSKVWTKLDASCFPELSDNEEFEAYRNKVNNKYKEN